jgi:ketosteroid isomerase-like protein
MIARKNTEICEVFGRGDIDAYVAHFTEDCFQMNPGTEPLVGRAATAEHWRNLTRHGSWSFDLRVQEVLANGDLAVERGLGWLSFEPDDRSPAGVKAWSEKANYVAVWRLEADGEWRICWDAPVVVGTE